MGNKRFYMMVIILLLAIGFGVTSAAVYLNGGIGLLATESDFADDIVFTSVTPEIASGSEKSGEVSLSNDGKTITFTAGELTSEGDTASLDFQINNYSTQYDASASVECSLVDTSLKNNLSVSITPDTYSIEAGSYATGNFKAKLVKAITEEKSATFKCTITATAGERTSAADESNTGTYSLTGVYEDESGNAVGNAVLVIASDPQVVTTDSNGNFSVSNLGAGTHHIYYMGTTSEVTAADFENKTIREIKAAAKGTTSFIVSAKGKITLSNGANLDLTTSLYDLIKSKASNETIDFSKTSSASGTNGVYTTTETEDGSEVYYYRGTVNNNLIFNNMCWEIIRTTETGGVKLIYNGTPTNGQCTSTGTDTKIGDSVYNNSTKDNGYIGYMYGDSSVWYYGIKKTSSTTTTFTSGKEYTWSKTYTFNASTGKYSLTNDIVTSDWNTLRVGYYTCKDTTSTCTTMYYAVAYNNTGSSTTVDMYSTSYSGSESYTEAHSNVEDSTVKTYIDTWFKNKFSDSMISKLEDTVFCNDRSIATDKTKSNTIYNTNGYGSDPTSYGVMERVTSSAKTKTPSLKCPQDNDKFTTNTSDGNGALTYPVGLITLDEVMFAGNSSCFDGTCKDSNYLVESYNYLTMSPMYYTPWGIIYVGSINNTGIFGISAVIVSNGVRPVISLKSGTYIFNSGDGTTTNPYVVN